MTDYLPLSQWRQRTPNHCVAVNQGEAILQSTLESRVGAWTATLPALAGQRWAVYHSDSYEFLCILLALWQLQATACIPADNRPGTVKRLLATMDGLAGEFDSDQAVRNPEPVTSPPNWIELAAEQVVLEIYTSGSTGAPKSINKTLYQLECELETIENCWPSQTGVVLATVSHQHLYGMTFALFWPLCSARAFETRICELIEEIVYRASLYKEFALVSSPSHLGRFGQLIEWDKVAPSCNFVMSSAAPLSREDSLTVSQHLDAPVREIYGSSETGAIAWRIQRAEQADARWRALPGVNLQPTENDQLRVRSSYLGDLDYYDLPDRVEMDADAGFRLLGRLDNIVKVEGKRVSLAAIEQALAACPWVKQVRALTLERTRVETAVVMQLSQVGQQALEKQSRRAVIDELKILLRHDFEIVVIPRRWRFVDEMPFNSQGKLTLDNMRALFVREESLWPKILAQQTVDGWLQLRCRIPVSLSYFEGHMPGRPILPGIVQVHWAEAYGRKMLGLEGRFLRLEVVKFQRVITPENELVLSLAYDSDKQKLSFRYESDRGTHSSGRICFG